MTTIKSILNKAWVFPFFFCITFDQEDVSDQPLDILPEVQKMQECNPAATLLELLRWKITPTKKLSTNLLLSLPPYKNSSLPGDASQTERNDRCSSSNCKANRTCSLWWHRGTVEPSSHQDLKTQPTKPKHRKLASLNYAVSKMAGRDRMKTSLQNLPVGKREDSG